jgi:hypothetical protein
MDERVAWVAAVGELGGLPSLLLYGPREVTISRDWSGIDRNGELMAESFHLGRMIREPGPHLLRYVGDGQRVIAEGRFVLVAGPASN